MVALIVLTLAWGAFAFGAVYRWAYVPLLIACAAAGLLGLCYGRRRHRFTHRGLMIALLMLMGGTALQLMPLPTGVLKTISPSTDVFLQGYDISYALGASHPLSINPAATALGLAFLVAFSVFLVGLLRGLTTGGAGRLATAVIGLGLVLALVGIVQRAVIGDHAFGGMKIYGFWEPEHKLSTPFGPFVNKNHFAGWMLMAIPLAAGLAVGRLEGRRGLRSTMVWLSSPAGGRFQLLLMSALLMTASLLMTRSRSGLGGLVAVILAVGFVAARRFRTARWSVLGAALLLFAVVFAWAGGEVTARIGKEMSAVELRRHIWTDSAAVIRDFPVFGTGLNTFGTAMLVYQTTDRDKHFQEAHNDYLQILVEGGLLLAVPMIAALAIVVSTVRRRFRGGTEDPETYWLRVGSTIGLLAIGLQSVVEFSLQMPGNAALCVVLLAIAMHEGKSSEAAGRLKTGVTA
jgi:O-antigen ligase